MIWMTQLSAVPSRLGSGAGLTPAELAARRPLTYSMFKDIQRKYRWVLDIHHYDDQSDLLDSLVDQVIRPAEAEARRRTTSLI